MFFYKIKYWALRPWVWCQRPYYRDLNEPQRLVYEIYNYSRAFKRLDRDTQTHDIINTHDLTEQSLVVVVGGQTSIDWVADMRKRYGCRLIVYTLTKELTWKFQFLYRLVDEVYIHPRPVEISHIRELIELIDRDRIDLIRFDARGGEYQLLSLLIKDGLHARLDQLMIQFREDYFASHLNRYLIGRRLKRTHRRVWNYPFVCEKWVRKQQTAEGEK